MLIGRSRRCDLKIESPLVSRRHCRLEPRDSGFFLRDLGSQNGTWIDGERIDHAFLQAGDRFVAGDVVLRITPEGSLAAEGQENPRTIKNPPRLSEQGPALAMVLLPLFAGVIAMIAWGGPEEPTPTPVARSESSTPSGPATPPPETIAATPAPIANDPVAARPAPVTPAAPVPPVEEATPVTPEYTLEELLAIAEDCDRAVAEREAEMADLLAPAPSAPIEEEIQPPSLAEAWEGIAGSAPEPVIASASAPLGESTASRVDPPRRSNGTAVAEANIVSPVEGPLLPESARRDLAEAIVEEGLALVDRYHVRDVSYVPLLPLIDRLRDLDGAPAAEGLLTLREKTHEHLSTVYRRVLKLEREARKADRDLDRKPRGGSAEREDELVLRLAEMVKEHLETLVLIRDRIEHALLAEGRPLFLTRAVEVSIAIEEERLFAKATAACVEFECWDAVPALLDGVGSSEPKIRKLSRATLEELSGEKPGTSERAWREWWRSAQERRSG